MKTQRRKKLETNVVADKLGIWIIAIRPYSKAILGVVIAIVMALAVTKYLSWNAEIKNLESWDAFSAAHYDYLSAIISGKPGKEIKEKLNKLEKIPKQYKDCTAEHWAQLTLGDIYRNLGIERLFKDREKAGADLDKAIEYYKQAKKSDSLTLQQRAMFGLGQALESRQGAEGNPEDNYLERASDAYLKYLEKWPAGPLAARAKKYRDRLQQPSTKDFYIQFSQPPAPKELNDDEKFFKNILEGTAKEKPDDPSEAPQNKKTAKTSLKEKEAPTKTDVNKKTVKKTPGVKKTTEAKKTSDAKETTDAKKTIASKKSPDSKDSPGKKTSDKKAPVKKALD